MLAPWLSMMQSFALHDCKVGVANAMLGMCVTLGTGLLLVCSSTSAHAVGDENLIVGDVRKLATLAVPLDVRVACKALSWGRQVNTYLRSWELVAAANRSNLGHAFDAYQVLAKKSDLAALEQRGVGTIAVPELRTRGNRSAQ